MTAAFVVELAGPALGAGPALTDADVRHLEHPDEP